MYAAFQIVPALAIGSSFRLDPVFFHSCASILFWALSYLLTPQDPAVSPYVSLLPTGSTTFPKSLGSLLWITVFRDQHLGTRCALCDWDVISSRPSQQTELGNICMYNDPCRYTYVYFFICQSAHIFEKYGFILILLIPTQHHRVHASLLPFPICNFSSWQSEAWLSYTLCLLFCSTIVCTESDLRIANPYPSEKQI